MELGQDGGMGSVQMSIPERILQRVKKYFNNNGFQSLEYEEETSELVFSSDKDTVLVKVLFEDESDMEALLHTLASITKKAPEYNMIYIAAHHRILKEGLDTSLFMRIGLGLIIYDDFDIYEEVSAESRKRGVPAKKTQQPVEAMLIEKNLMRIEYSIRGLSERVESLEKAYLSLLREVREIRSIVEKRGIPTERIIQKASVESGELVEVGDLPSFLKDNPWVEILSKRSEEDL